MFDFKKIQGVAKKLIESHHTDVAKQQSQEKDKGVRRTKIKDDADPTAELVTIQEAAVILKCSPPAVRKYVRQGFLPVVRIGGNNKYKNVFIRRKLLDSFWENAHLWGLRKINRPAKAPTPHLALIRELLEKDPYYTLQELGDHCGITRERVRQILYANNISKIQGKRDRFKPSTYVSAHIKDNAVTDINIGADSYISKTEVLEFLDPENEKFLGLSLDRIQTNTIHITSQLRPWKKTDSSIRKYCEKGHHIICFNKPQDESSWRCYVCKSLYSWEYINAKGKVEKEAKTKPCNNCGKTVTKRAAILWRQEQDERYHGNFYCDRKCFYDYQNKQNWWASSPIFQGTYWSELRKTQRTCVICNTSFETKSTKTILCSAKCKNKRIYQLSKAKRDRTKKKRSPNATNLVSELLERGMKATYIASYLNCNVQTVYLWKQGSRPSERNRIQLKRLAQITRKLGI